ncbi:MAG: hypothetical protein ACFCBW_21565 [Candidatus Competibacterales bacterium]
MGLARFAMGGPNRAAIVVTLASLLPPVFFIGGGALALVTLRRGPRAGLEVAALAAVGLLLLSWLWGLQGQWLWILALAHGLPVWGLAWWLRATVSLASTLKLLLGAAIALVLLSYPLLGDPRDWWQVLVAPYRDFLLGQDVGGTEGEVIAQLFELLNDVAPLAPGLFAFNAMLFAAVALLLGRAWQSTLYNPGGFRTEMRQLRLGKPLAMAAAGTFTLALVLGSPLLTNVMMLFSLVFLLQGIALFHGLAAGLRLSPMVVVIFYLGVFFLPELVIIFGIIDAWADFRARLNPRSPID